MTETFNIGDRVRMNPDCEHYNDNSGNLNYRDGTGVVVEIADDDDNIGSLPIKTTWTEVNGKVTNGAGFDSKELLPMAKLIHPTLITNNPPKK